METFDPHLLLTVLLRLFWAAAAGFVIGFPFRCRPGGLRTHALVAAAAALFCMLGVALSPRDNTELARIIQGIIQGVGFIGAASVLRQGGEITGVNTAASILIVAVVGCFIGTMHPLYGLAIALFLTAANVLLRMLEERIKKAEEGRSGH